MQCENSFCIYFSNGQCILDAIEVNSVGMCAECIYPNIDETILNEAKLKLLKHYENED
mgnify:CR=1 FL=1